MKKADIASTRTLRYCFINVATTGTEQCPKSIFIARAVTERGIYFSFANSESTECSGLLSARPFTLAYIIARSYI
jgi:hypothetical protein